MDDLRAMFPEAAEAELLEKLAEAEVRAEAYYDSLKEEQSV